MPGKAPLTKVAVCPSLNLLSQLASGSLDEQVAAKLLRHVDACQQCGNAMDELARRADGLIRAARRSGGHADTGSDPSLDRLIQVAQNLTAGDSARNESMPSSGEETTREVTRKASDSGIAFVSLEEFVRGLKSSGLMRENTISQLVDSVQPTSGVDFAKRLVADDKLTKFQAGNLLKGRSKRLVLGKYILLEKLGQGGMGSVFKARHIRMGRTVCLKVMRSQARQSPQLMKRFRQEARTAAALSHPNIVVAHDADDADGLPFLVMEFIEGRDLHRHVAENGPLDAAKAAEIILQVAHALEYTHDQGVIHRDIKPHNLLLTTGQDGESDFVKVLDMGLARFDTWLSENPDASMAADMTNTGVIMGTVDYMSPEQAVNTRDADHRADIYALGCTLFFLLNGRPLYEGATLMARLIAHREQPIPPLTSASSGIALMLDAVFRRAVAKHRDDRYQSMAEFARDLETVLDGRPVNVPVAAPTPLTSDVVAANRLVTVPDHGSSILTQVAGRRPKRPLNPWVAALICVGMVGACVAVALLDVQGMFQPETLSAGTSPFETPQPPEPPPSVGNPHTLVNGGNGRALVVVPFDRFYDKEFIALTDALKQRGVTYAIASSKEGKPIAKHNEVHVSTDLALADFSTDDFDAVFFPGGLSMWEFTHRQEDVQEETRRVVTASLENGLVVASFTNGCEAWKELGLCEECQYSKDREIERWQPQDQPGVMLKSWDSGHMSALLDIAFTEVLSSTRQPLQAVE